MIQKNDKGITLVALVITIIVILILAAVTIGTLKQSGIIEKSKNAKSEFENAQENDVEIVNGYKMYIDEKLDESTEKSKEKNKEESMNNNTVENGITIEVNQFVDKEENLSFDLFNELLLD